MLKKSFFSSGLLKRGLDCSRASWMRPLTNGGNDWERVSMHRVVTLNTLCSIASIYFATKHNRFFSEPPTFFEENHVLSNLWATSFFARYCITSSQVRWANLQSTSVKFLQDAVCQKSSKSVNIWPSYYKKNKNVSCFWDTVYMQTRALTLCMAKLVYSTAYPIPGIAPHWANTCGTTAYRYQMKHSKN